MDIRTECMPFVTLPAEKWTAVDDDTYDGPGSPIGTGPTREAAIADLREQIADRNLKAAERMDGRTMRRLVFDRQFQLPFPRVPTHAAFIGLASEEIAA